jgi:chaperonin GroES
MEVNNIIPLAGYMVVEPDKVEQETSFGIYLPKSATDKVRPQTGTGLRLSNDGEAPVKVGDHIVYTEWAGNTVTIGDKDYEFLRYEDILAIYER